MVRKFYLVLRIRILADGVVPDVYPGQNGWVLFFRIQREHHIEIKVNESVIKMSISTVLLGNNDFS